MRQGGSGVVPAVTLVAIRDPKVHAAPAIQLPKAKAEASRNKLMVLSVASPFRTKEINAGTVRVEQRARNS